MKSNDTAPTFEQLIDWLEGRSSAEQAERVAAYVATAGEKVQADVAWLRRFYDVAARAPVAEPPAILTERLERRFAAFARDRAPLPLRQRLIATLRFDSTMSLARGVRAADAGSHQRQYLFETEKATVVCTVQQREQDELVDVLGQVLAEEESEASLTRVSLLRKDEEYDNALTDDLGEFTLSAIPHGLYDMVLDSLGYQIVITSINLSVG
jgi:hypothetical protein